MYFLLLFLLGYFFGVYFFRFFIFLYNFLYDFIFFEFIFFNKAQELHFFTKFLFMLGFEFFPIYFDFNMFNRSHPDIFYEYSYFFLCIFYLVFIFVFYYFFCGYLVGHLYFRILDGSQGWRSQYSFEFRVYSWFFLFCYHHILYYRLEDTISFWNRFGYVLRRSMLLFDKKWWHFFSSYLLSSSIDKHHIKELNGTSIVNYYFHIFREASILLYKTHVSFYRYDIYEFDDWRSYSHNWLLFMHRDLGIIGLRFVLNILHKGQETVTFRYRKKAKRMDLEYYETIFKNPIDPSVFWIYGCLEEEDYFVRSISPKVRRRRESTKEFD